MENNNEGVVTQPEEGKVEGVDESVTLKKADYDTLNQTLGSLKRELKDLKKAKEEPKETTKNQTEEFGLLQKSYLRSAGVTSDDEVALAKEIKKQTGLDWDKLVDDDYFKHRLESLRNKRANEIATTNIRGERGATEAKLTPEYWLSKGVPPTAQDIPDRKVRAKIARAFMAQGNSNGKKFYND